MAVVFSLLFAASVAAQITTSIWMPGGYNQEEVGFYGSVIGKTDDRVTMAIVYDNETDTRGIGVYNNVPETVTIAGLPEPTHFEGVVTSTDNWDSSEFTMSLECDMATRARASATCTYSLGGEAIYSSYCADYLSYTDIVTTTYDYYSYTDLYGPGTLVTTVETYDYRSIVPDWCVSGSTLPESLVLDTTTIGRGYIETYQIIITAGQEKLDATAGATITGTGARVTGTGTETGTGSSADGTITRKIAAAVETGAAIPMITVAPGMAGIGAAAAAFLL